MDFQVVITDRVVIAPELREQFFFLEGVSLVLDQILENDELHSRQRDLLAVHKKISPDTVKG